MKDIKLIFIDGNPGSGKSTTAHFIARQLKKNDIKVKWFYEEERNHPLKLIKKDEDENGSDFIKRLLIEYPKYWISFVEEAKKDDSVIVIESYLFQDVMLPFFKHYFERQTIKDLISQLMDIVSDLNPVIIYYYQKDAAQACRNNWERRGRNWREAFIEESENSFFAKHINVKGEKASFEFLQEMTNISLELFNDFEFRKIKIETSAQDWDNYRVQIMEFLNLPMAQEILFHSSFNRYCGYYSGFTVHINDKRLCIDMFWPNLKLIPIGNDEFVLEGFPIVLQFLNNNHNEITDVKILKALCYYNEGDILKKYTPIELSKDALEKFCGEYYCEASDLSRKIDQKKNALYFYQRDEIWSKLVALSPTKLSVKGEITLLTFDFTEKAKQFVLEAPGQKSMLFKDAPNSMKN